MGGEDPGETGLHYHDIPRNVIVNSLKSCDEMCVRSGDLRFLDPLDTGMGFDDNRHR